MMEVEERVSGRGKRITARVDGGNVVARGVNLISNDQLRFFFVGTQMKLENLHPRGRGHS